MATDNDIIQSVLFICGNMVILIWNQGHLLANKNTFIY